MATETLNLVTDQAVMTHPSQNHSDKEERIFDDDTNNNAQDKVLPESPALKIHESFTKSGRQENKGSPRTSQESPVVSYLKDEGLKAPTSKNWTMMNDLKTGNLMSSNFKHRPRIYDGVPGSSRDSVVLPLLTSEPAKDEGSRESEKGFTEYFSQSVVVGADWGKILSAGGETSKSESGMMMRDAIDTAAAVDHLDVVSTMSLSSAEPFGSGLVSSKAVTENSSKNRQKPGAHAPSQAAPVKPRCAPAREAVDPAKYFTLTDEPDGTKYACSKCGNVYKWRKSLNKHWKEKHDGETPNLHARPPPSLLQRERFLSPLRGSLKHSIFHQPSYHGPDVHPAKSSASPVITPPRLHSAHGGRNIHGTSPHLFGKFPDGREMGKIAHQVEEPVTAVVRPSCSNQPPVAPLRWNNQLSSSGGKPVLDLHSSPLKLKVPMVESIKKAHQHAQSRDTFGQMFSAVQGHHMLRGGPLDLSGTLASRTSSNDDNILDLSQKAGPDVFSSADKNFMTSAQDEPLDFSAKSLNKSLGYQRNVGLALSESSFSARWFPVVDKKDSMTPKAMEFSDIGLDSKSLFFSINDFNKPSQVLCACCHLPCETSAELNHHFVRNHMSVLYETASDVNSGGHHRSSNSVAQMANVSGNQLVRHLAWENTKKSLACVVCGMSVQWSWMLGKHFEQVHSSIQPNPYKKTSGVSAASAVNNSGAVPPASLPNLQCETCSFTAVSLAEFSRHQLKHSLAKDTREQESRNHSGYPQFPDDDQKKDPTLKCTAGSSQFNKFSDEIIDLEGEGTAIVIPRAPEETYLRSSSSDKYLNDTPSPDDSPSAFEAGAGTPPGDCIAVPRTPEETSAAGSSPVHSTPSGSKGSRSKKDPGLSAESLLPFKCERCEYRARWPSEMMQHMKNHSDEKPYQCPQCSYRSKWKWDVIKHLKRCGGGGSAKDVIDTTLTKKSYVKSLLIDPYSHQSTYDGTHSDGSQGFSGFYDQSNPSRCPANFAACSGTSDVNEDGYDNCDTDDDTVSDDLSLCKTEQGGNETGQSNSLACPQCPFVGHSPAELKRHLRVHSDEKPYGCETCNYSSKWKCDLKKHLKAYSHSSAVPLSYGGHGKKPGTWSRMASQMSCSDGKTSEEMEDGDLRFLLQGGCRGKREEPGSERPLSRESGNLFGGITFGGRLKCRQCEFEAIDITSFLQHKKTHRNHRTEDGKRNGANSIKGKSPLPSRHHRRKSFKQNRVLPTAGGREFPDGNLKVTGASEPEDDNLETKRFWDSLGLQSTSLVHHKGKSSSVVESEEDYNDPDSSDAEMEIDSIRRGSPSKRARYDSPEDSGFMRRFSQTSNNSYELSSDVETDRLESNESGSHRVRAKRELEMGSVEKVERFPSEEAKASECSLVVRNPFQAVRRGLRQGITTTEAEDAVGMSKRKRKLRTCEKCGYITDNLTTLQRHAAKHGSGGRHRCWMCDYSVDRQHVLEYHVRIVHEGAGSRPEDRNNCGTKAEKPNGAGKRSPESFPENVESHPMFDRGSFGGKRKIVCTTSVITIRGHDMEMIQKGNKTWYNCVKCHFVSSNITNAVNHAKQHGATKKYKCKHCDYSLDRKSSIANHMISQHSQSNAFQFDMEHGEHHRLESGEGRWRGELHGNESRFSLLDRMGANWNKHTCIRCGFCRINPTRMLLHRLSHGVLDKEFRCGKCKYRTTSARLLASHRKSHQSVDCFCGVNSSGSHSAMIPSDQRQQCCEKCSNDPKSSEISNDSTKVLRIMEDVSLGFGKTGKGSEIQCRFCPFVTSSSLKSFIHSQHHNSLKKLACSSCSFRANVRNVLFHHRKLHLHAE